MKIIRKNLLLAILLFTFYSVLSLSCATTEYLTKGNVSFENEIDQKTAMDGIVYVLTEHGFGIQMVNESFGLIESDWKQTSDISDNIGATILAGTLTGSNTYYNEFLKLNFRVTGKGYTVTPLYKQEQQKSNIIANTSTTNGAKAPVKTSDEGKFTMALVEEINALLDINGSINWE